MFTIPQDVMYMNVRRKIRKIMNEGNNKKKKRKRKKKKKVDPYKQRAYGGVISFAECSPVFQGATILQKQNFFSSRLVSICLTMTTYICIYIFIFLFMCLRFVKKKGKKICASRR